MLKLFNADILDIFPIDDGFVYAAKETLAGGDEAVTFHTYDIKNDIFRKISVNDYIICKFGDEGFSAARNTGDFVTCSLHQISQYKTIVAYPNGKILTLNEYGMIIDEKKVEYRDYPACGCAFDGKDVWLTVPDANSVIKYSLKYGRTEFRVGNSEDKAFLHPMDIKFYDGCLYICAANSCKIRILSPEDYSIKDYQLFHEPVYRYFRTDNLEFVHLYSGVYQL